MSVIIKESELPQELTNEDAVEAAYAAELTEVASKLQRGLPTLIECDKELGPYLYLNVRNRLRNANLRCLYLDGRPRQEEQQGMMPQGMIGTMISQLREAVRGAVERRVVVLPHLDLLTTSQGGLTAEAREVIPLLYENPELVWLGFKDPSFSLPKVIENLFPHRISLLGISRNRLRYLITRRESRKFGREFNPWGLYKYVSGVNAVRLRKLLSTMEGEDYPADPKRAYTQLRQATLGNQMEVPTISIDKDIGGYVKVKDQLRNEVLNLLARKDQLTDEGGIKNIEELLPKGMIFWGPPGTGKTLFAKAMASEIGAAVTVVSGPELKSKWVGESLPYEEEVFVLLNGEAKRIAIGELVENHSRDDVRTWTVRDDGSALIAPVTGFIRHKGPDYVDVLVTETGRRVTVTGGHSLFVEQDGKLGEVFAEQVEPGKTRVAVPLRLQAPETVTELHTAELIGSRFAAQEGGSVAVRVGRKARPLPAVMPLKEELAEFLGLWTAEGCYVRAGVRVTVHEDEAARVETLMRKLFGHVTVYRKPTGGKGVDLILSHAELRRLMEDGLEMPTGSRNKRVPPVIFLAPKPVVAAFLRGYFSGDGSFSGKYVEATTVSVELARDVMTLLQYFGIAARLRQKPERTGSISHRVRFLWSGFLRTFLNEIGFADARRNEALRAYLDNMTFKRDVQMPAHHVTNDVLWDLVVEKRREPYAREHVYDLSVPETERFIAGVGNVLVHNSEDNLRQIFHKARQCAPSIIVFDEIDSFATARGTYTGSGVEHSMVNQLLTEMDGFHKEEMVFVVGTTNFAESLDPALLRPGRFEFHLHIPYPDKDARREIIKIYDKKMNLKLSDAALDYAVRRTGDGYSTAQDTAFSGDHLNAMCRGLARIRMRDARTDESTPQDVERALTEYEEKPDWTPREEKILSTHEAGHAVCSLFSEFSRPIERITIRSENSWAAAYVQYREDLSRRLGLTYRQMMTDLTVLYGGIEAERLLLDDVSTGAAGSDLVHATRLAHYIVEMCGMGGEELGLRQYLNPKTGERLANLSPEQLGLIDKQVSALITEARTRAATILQTNKAVLELLRDELIKNKTIESGSIKTMFAKAPAIVAQVAEEKAEAKEKEKEKEKAETPEKEPKKARKTKSE